MFDFIDREGLSDIKVNQLPPLVLAYVGDAIYEVFVRASLVESGCTVVNKLHRNAINFVSAKSQAEIVRGISESLSEDERYIIKRGRNAKSATVPKNADIVEYRTATGLEALFGYLYLKKDYERLKYLINKIMEYKEGDSEE